ncbi:hypothetical protein GQX74_005763 [Glossina fuscipes]|nr:hypothetical protein GQX74_005763 [Glossina fuscipes]
MLDYLTTPRYHGTTMALAGSESDSLLVDLDLAGNKSSNVAINILRPFLLVNNFGFLATQARCKHIIERKTIVDIIIEDFSTTPFNSPTASPESKLRNLERSTLFILREKPKRNYSCEFRARENQIWRKNSRPLLMTIMIIYLRKRSFRSWLYRERGHVQPLVPPSQSKNQRKTGISPNWDEDDNDIFASIILDQNEKISKFQENKQAGFQTANGKKISISEERKMSIQNIRREFQDYLQKTDYETELKDIIVRISNKSVESKFRTTGTRKRLMALNDESNQTGHSTLNVPKFRKKHSLSLNPKFNFK